MIMKTLNKRTFLLGIRANMCAHMRVIKVLIKGLQIRVCNGKLFFLFLNQNICCGYSKEPSHRDGSFEHPKHMFKLMGKKIIKILR